VFEETFRSQLNLHIRIDPILYSIYFPNRTLVLAIIETAEQLKQDETQDSIQSKYNLIKVTLTRAKHTKLANTEGTTEGIGLRL